MSTSVGTNMSMSMSMSIADKLALDKFYVDEDNAHIEIDKDYPDLGEKQKLVKACPAGLYSLDEDGHTLNFDYAGCLECGTCRILALGTVIKKWEYPTGTFGVEYRMG
jgi:ferredoxin-like protein FixX